MAPPESDGSFVFTMSQGRQCWEMLGGVSAPRFFCSIGASKEHLHQAWRPYPWSWSNQSGRSGFTGHHSDRNMGFIRQSFSSISNHLLWILEYLGTATFFTRPRLHKSQALQCQVCRARNALGRSNSPVPMVHSSSARLVDYIVSYLYILMWVKQ